MSFVLKNFSRISVSYNQNVPRGYRYISAEDEGNTILLSGYFNSLRGTLKVNDIINVLAVDENLDVKVIALDPIETERFMADFITSVTITNLTVTAGNLNTIQDIGQGSVPTFARLSVGGGGGGPATPAILELDSQSQAFLMTRLTTAERDAITGPLDGLLLYNVTLNKVQAFANGVWVSLH